MPPPKKPKNGPTSAEQFLSQEELQSLEKEEEKETPASKNGAEPPPAKVARLGGGGHGSTSSQRSNHRSRNSGVEKNSGTEKHAGLERAGADRGAAAARERSSGGGDRAERESKRGEFKILRELFTKQQDDVRPPPSLQLTPSTPRAGRLGKGATPHGYRSAPPKSLASRDSFPTPTPHRGDQLQGTSAASRDTGVPCDAVSASSPVSRPQATITSDTSSSSSSTSTSLSTFPQLWGSSSGSSQQRREQLADVVRPPASLAAVDSAGFRPAALVHLPPSDKATSASRASTSAAMLVSGVDTAPSHLPLYSASAKKSSPAPHSAAPGPHEPFDLSVRRGPPHLGKASGLGRPSATAAGKEGAGERVKLQDLGPQGGPQEPGGSSSTLSTFPVSQTLYLKGGGGQGFLYQGPTPGPLPPRGTVYLSGDVARDQGLVSASVIGRATPHVMNILCGGRPIPSASLASATSAAAAVGMELGRGAGSEGQTSPPLRPPVRHSLSTDSPASSKDSQPDSAPASPYEEAAGGADTKSPREEVRMVSPGTCMSMHAMLPSTSHMQAPSSTTPEACLEAKYCPPMDPHALHGLTDRPIIKTEPRAGSSSAPKLCQVCDDNASGFHYGVWSCEGCKAFFKRSIQGPVDYVCPATNNCTIDKHRRKSCQACRLRKCYEVGMNKGSQRKTERKNSSGSTSSGKGKRCRADSSDAAVNSTSGGPQISSPSKAKRCRETNLVLEALQKAELPTLESQHNHSLPPTRVHLLSTLVKLADQELVYLINWAKHVPGYTELSLGDQVHLIECCWMELLLLNCAFRSMDCDGKRLIFAPDFALERQHWDTIGMMEILQQVAAVSEQMSSYHVSKEELLLLQATILVNAEVRRLASFTKIKEMRHMIVDTFLALSQRYHAEDPTHMPSLLLLLTHLRQAGEHGIAFFQQLKRENCGVSFCDLLTEMLEVHGSCDRNRVANPE